MRCSLKSLSLFFFVLLGSFVGSFIINQNDSFALDSYSYTLNAPFSNTTIYQPGNNPYNFVPKFIKIDINYLGSNSCTSSFLNPTSFSVLVEDVNTGTTGARLSVPIIYNSYCSSIDNYFNVENFLNYYSSTRFNYLYVSGNQNSNYQFVITLYDSAPFASAPSGNLDITENGEYDVASYSTVNVNVPQEIPVSYHDDLMVINQSILICGAIMLILYFFYCIYRMIIKTVGSYNK